MNNLHRAESWTYRVKSVTVFGRQKGGGAKLIILARIFLAGNLPRERLPICLPLIRRDTLAHVINTANCPWVHTARSIDLEQSSNRARVYSSTPDLIRNTPLLYFQEVKSVLHYVADGEAIFYSFLIALSGGWLRKKEVLEMNRSAAYIRAANSFPSVLLPFNLEPAFN